MTTNSAAASRDGHSPLGNAAGDNARVALQHARALRESADYEGALSSYQRAWELVPEGDALAHDAYLEAGMVWGFVGEFERSIEALQDVARRWPTSPEAHLNLGKTLLMLGDYALSRPVLERAMSLAPSNSSTRDEANKQLQLLQQFGY